MTQVQLAVNILPHPIRDVASTWFMTQVQVDVDIPPHPTPPYNAPWMKKQGKTLCLWDVRRRKRMRPENSPGPSHRAPLPHHHMLAIEVGGRWSEEAAAFINNLARAKARPPIGASSWRKPCQTLLPVEFPHLPKHTWALEFCPSIVAGKKCERKKIHKHKPF